MGADLPPPEDLETKILAGRFTPIDVDAGKCSSQGWAYAFGEPEVFGELLDIGRVLITPYVALFFRIETISIPHSVWRRELAKRIKALGEDLTADEEKALGDDVWTVLRKRAIPEVSGVTVYIDPVGRRVYVGQATKTVREDIESALEDLGLIMVINSPFAAGVLEERDGAVDTSSQELGALYPDSFTEWE